jgi:serine/threonine protein phosphatase 1
MMLTAQAGFERHMWLACGGDETLESYGVVRGSLPDLDPVPEAHYHFMAVRCRSWYETDTHIFVHANLHADLELADQPAYMLLWERLDGPVRHFSGKTMICGHTRQVSGLPWHLGTTICIDTGAHTRLGWLTCLDVKTGHAWQANQLGKVRVFQIEEAMDAGVEFDF